MKINKLCILPLACLSLISCSKNGVDLELANKLASQESTSVRITCIVTNSKGKTLNNLFRLYTYDATNKIEHMTGNSTIYSNLEEDEPLASQTKREEYYKTQARTYTLGVDGKYTITNQENTIAPFKIGYDFTKCSELKLDGEDLTGKVSKDNIASFIKSEVDANEINLKGSYEDNYLTELDLDYVTSSNLTVSYNFQYGNSNQTLILPTN